MRKMLIVGLVLIITASLLSGCTQETIYPINGLLGFDFEFDIDSLEIKTSAGQCDFDTVDGSKIMFNGLIAADGILGIEFSHGDGTSTFTFNLKPTEATTFNVGFTLVNFYGAEIPKPVPLSD